MGPLAKKRDSKRCGFWSKSIVFILLVGLAVGISPPSQAPASHTTPGWSGSALHLGSVGEAVRSWQRALNITADGAFGPDTFAATRAWQRSRGLIDTGWVGPSSWGEMFGEVPGNGQVTVEGAGWGHGIGMSQYGAYTMARDGLSAERILAYYYNGAVPRSYQEVLGPGSWIVNDPRPLWISLISGNRQAVLRAEAPVTSCWPLPGLLREGNSGIEVERLQDTLTQLGYDPGPSDGNFSAKTNAAVIKFQTDQDLLVDGIVGEQTAKVLWPNRVGECFVEAAPVDGELVIWVDDDGNCRVDSWPKPLRCWGSVFGISEQSIVGVEVGSRVKQIASDVLRIRPARNDTLHVLWETAIDPYVAGLAEVPSAWPPAALQAQAIAARSYAVASAIRIGSESRFSSTRRSACWCHLYGDARSQYYLGHQKASNELWGPEVRRTDGLVLEHPNSGLVQAFYSSSSGGRTEFMDEIWSGSRRDYLVVVDDSWVLDPRVNPNAVWVHTFSPSNIAGKFDLGELISLRVAARNTSGSVRTIEMVGTKTTKRVSGGTFQSIMRLKSRYYNVEWPVPLTTDNRAPQGRAGLDPIEISVGDPDTIVDVSSSFFDANGDVLTFSVNNDQPELLSATVNGTKIALEGLKVGRANLEILASDPDDGTALQPLRVTVTSPPQDLGSIELQLDDPLYLQDLTELIVDTDGEILPTEISVEDQDVITAELVDTDLQIQAGELGSTTIRITVDTASGIEVKARLLVSVIEQQVEQVVEDQVRQGQFTDDDDNIHEHNIDQIASMGITQGCDPPDNSKFCPERSVSRAEMASFMVRALSLGPSDFDWFEDDQGTTHEEDINRLAWAGLTLGCDPPKYVRFCPDRPVTRAEMATFLTRGFILEPAVVDWFSDDQGTTHEDSINRLSQVGWTTGCNPPESSRYCPDRPLSRAELASFLVRALRL